MSYSLRKNETVQDGIQRIISELAAESEEHARSDGDVDERIHEIRKALKRVRAALRLVRTTTEVYARENARYRDIGRLLSDLRDTAARIETVDELDAHLAAVVDRPVLDVFRAELVEQHRRAFAAVDLAALFEEVSVGLSEGRDALGALQLDATGFDAVGGGLAKSYRRGRQFVAETGVESSVEVFHTWRKRVKYHRYHIDLLAGLWGPILGEWEDVLHDLTDDLGLAHDVAVLDDFLVESPDVLGDSVATQRIRRALHDVSTEARRASLRRGRRAYAETPEAMTERFRCYWEAWRH